MALRTATTMGPFFLALCTNIIILTRATDSSGPCTVCPNGDPISEPNKELYIPGFEFIQTCQQLSDSISLLLRSDSPECIQLQSLGSLCGCPIADAEQACYLCNGDPDATLANPFNPIPLFQEVLPGNLPPNCELVEANLHTLNKDDALCRTSQAFLSSYCGCSNIGGSTTSASAPSCQMCSSGVLYPSKTIDLFGFETCADLDDAVELLLKDGTDQCAIVQSIAGLCGCESLPSDPCTICRDGSSSVPDPLINKEIPFLQSDTGPFASFGVAPTCRLYEAYLLSIDANDAQCPLAQGMGSYCGCPPVPDHCEFCPDHPIDPQYYNKTLHFLSAVEEAGVSPTCEFAETLLKQVSSDDLVQCYGIQQRSFLCGCNDGVWLYAETKNEAQKRAMAWIPRGTGLLSLLVSDESPTTAKTSCGWITLYQPPS